MAMSRKAAHYLTFIIMDSSIVSSRIISLVPLFQMNTNRASCVPCCLVLSRFKLLMCHEDLETNFIRTLGSVNLNDVTSVLTDELNNNYIILVGGSVVYL